MLKRSEVERAVAIQRAGYRLLNWLEGAASSGAFAPELLTATGEQRGGETWVVRNHHRLPPDLQVAPADIEDFGRYFASYLQSTFVFEADPSARFASSTGCFCEVCALLDRRNFLQPVRVTGRDRQVAESMRLDFLSALADDQCRSVPTEALEALLSVPELREPLSLCTYTVDLLARMRGETVGTASLVLWRGFAWTKEGSPKKGFVLDSDEILAAEVSIDRAIGEVA